MQEAGSSYGSVLVIAPLILLLSPLLVFYLKRWQWALLGYIIYLPVSGYIAIKFNRHPIALQAKEFFFLVPAYIGFVLFLQSRIRFSGIPRGFTLAAVCLLLLCMVQLINPTVHAPNPLVGLLGIKVWTFHIPLLMIAYIYVSDPRNLLILVRTIVVSSWIPCSVGLLQYVLSLNHGFEKTMRNFYGEEAYAVSFGFGEMNTAAGVLFRLPSTFTFVTQYSFFLLAVVCFLPMAIQIETNRYWKIISYATFLLAVMAALLSGARYLLYLTPLILITFFVLQRGLLAAIYAAIFFALTNAVLWLGLGYNAFAQAENYAGLIVKYLFYFFPATTLAAVKWHPLGMGVGTATSQVRYLERFVDFPIKNVEGYLGKAGYELGIPGVVIVAALMLIPLLVNVRNIRRARDPKVRAIVVSLFLYQGSILLQSLKANPLDQDPSNFFFWISVGFSFRINAFLNTLDLQVADMPRISLDSPPVEQVPQPGYSTPSSEEELSSS